MLHPSEEPHIWGQTNQETVGRIVDEFHRRVSFRTLRSVKEFTGHTEVAPYGVPAGPQLSARLKVNGTYFLTNYLGIALLVSLYFVMTHTWFILFSVILAYGWSVVLRMRESTAPLTVATGIHLYHAHRLMIMAGLTGLTALLYFSMLMYIALISGAVSAAHATLRNCPNMKEEGEDVTSQWDNGVDEEMARPNPPQGGVSAIAPPSPNSFGGYGSYHRDGAGGGKQ